MKHLFTIFLLFVGLFSFSQGWDFEKPNYKKIEKNIKKKRSNLYYKTLMSRYMSADTTMTLEEKRHLYYGYSFHKNYSPYSSSDYSDSLNDVLDKEEFNNVDQQKIIKFSDYILKENPFDLSAINHQLFALEQTGNKEEFNKKLIQFKIVLDALMSSGNGLNKNDAFYVIFTSHEYHLLSILGLEFGGEQNLIEDYDYLKVAPNEFNIEGLYFEISPCLGSLMDMFK